MKSTISEQVRLCETLREVLYDLLTGTVLIVNHYTVLPRYTGYADMRFGADDFGLGGAVGRAAQLRPTCRKATVPLSNLSIAMPVSVSPFSANSGCLKLVPAA